MVGLTGIFGLSLDTGGFRTTTDGLGVPLRIDVEEDEPKVNGLLRVNLTLDVFDRFSCCLTVFLDSSTKDSASFEPFNEPPLLT